MIGLVTIGHLFCTYKGGQVTKPIIYIVAFLASADIKVFGHTHLPIYNAVSDWPHTFFTPRVFLFSTEITKFFSPKEKAEFSNRAAECRISYIHNWESLHSTMKSFSKHIICLEGELSKELAKKDLIRIKKSKNCHQISNIARNRVRRYSSAAQYVKKLETNGTIINTAIVMTTVKSIVQHLDVNLLAKHREPVAIAKPLARSLMLRMHCEEVT